MKTAVRYILIVAILVCLPNSVLAANIFFGKNPTSFDIGQQISVPIYLNTQGEIINTVSTTVNYPSDLLEVQSINDNTSVVSFWVENSDDGAGHITLSGLIPGGYFGEGGEIVTIVFKTIKSGHASVYSGNTELFLNDGLGTSIYSPETSYDIDISSNVFVSQKPVQNDFNKPESFLPEISKSDSLFDNKYFVVFSTKDKGSGVSYYLMKEARFKSLSIFKGWRDAESPYVLEDQSLTSYIFIKAVDRQGNYRLEIVSPQNKDVLGQVIITLATIILVILFLLLLSFLLHLVKRAVRRLVLRNEQF